MRLITTTKSSAWGRKHCLDLFSSRPLDETINIPMDTSLESISTIRPHSMMWGRGWVRDWKTMKLDSRSGRKSLAN